MGSTIFNHLVKLEFTCIILDVMIQASFIAGKIQFMIDRNLRHTWILKIKST